MALLEPQETALARFCLEAALRKGAQKARVSLNKSTMDLVGTLNGEIDKVTRCLDRSLSVVLLVDGRFGSFSLNRLEEAADILRRFPTLKLIIAHPTASPADYTARLELIAQYPNAALDISGSGPNSWGMVRHGIRTAGLDKIVFGTDYPIRNPGMYVAGVYAEKLTDAEMTAVFSGNLKRLLGLG